MSLQISNLTKSYGALMAMNDLSMTLEPGNIYGLIGPNGAGKSTFVNLIAGSYTISSGSIRLDGERLDGKAKYKISLAGVARTYQNIRLFDRMTALENLEVCLYPVEKGSTLRDLFFWRSAARHRERRREHCLQLLRQFDLEKYADEQAGTLPYGRQRMLEICRALVRQPRVLLLDEPAAGLNESESRELKQRIAQLRRPDLIIIVIEHDMELIMSLSDHVIVLHNGALLYQGTPQQVQANSEVQEAYLGTENELDDIRESARNRKSQRRVRA
ncbi:ABC transporter ATP-binding protein [Pseudomonas cavernae]|uniref:ABC transporter ATP-binding protein n=1 Tax=Pseudomonas cavernae TaxID=2320867 RepID=A0A385Z4X6_9PSED|nr:ABC transporter ATP-binding protein [Pseudomonas cavernae]AYC32993.1 ABC transporter ATP-binding protein [Pseudomonas cavernae]